MTPLDIPRNISKNASMDPKTPILSQRMFCMPLPTHSIGFCILGSRDLNVTPNCSPTLLLAFTLSSLCPPILPLAASLLVALPLSPLPQNYPKMVYS
jgi:hypothetical protein